MSESQPAEALPGIFEKNSLKQFDREQAWRLDARYSEGFFCSPTRPQSLSHALFRVRHGASGELNTVYGNLVYHGGNLPHTGLRQRQEHIDKLRQDAGDDEDSRAALDILQAKTDSKRDAWQTARRERLADIIVAKRGDLHVLVQTNRREVEIDGFFGKLWGITVADTDEHGFEIYAPVVIGKDAQPALPNVSQKHLWLYRSKLD